MYQHLFQNFRCPSELIIVGNFYLTCIFLMTFKTFLVNKTPRKTQYYNLLHLQDVLFQLIQTVNIYNY